MLIPHKDDVKIESLAAFKDYLVVFQRLNGLQVMSVLAHMLFQVVSLQAWLLLWVSDLTAGHYILSIERKV